MVQVDHTFRNKKGMHHHLLMHLHLKIEVSIAATIHSTSRLDELNLKVGLLHVPSVVDTTQEILIMAK